MRHMRRERRPAGGAYRRQEPRRVGDPGEHRHPLPRCHYRYDQTAERHMIRAQLEEYITTIYPDWTEEAVTYHKY